MSGYAVTGAVLGMERLVAYATNGAKFLKRHMFDVASGRLMRTCYAGSGGTVEHRCGLGIQGRLVSLGAPGLSLPLSSLRVDSTPGSAICPLSALDLLGPPAHPGNGLIVPTSEVGLNESTCERGLLCESPSFPPLMPVPPATHPAGAS